ncbi:MAG TPA: anhydro-N-acetylmuramic acid kinase [Gemmatimonadaceae bacterium]|nr:anhydro-N-acetylmuramic acid kinase [Gemmatimonadaceae bacterium]
MTGAAGQKPGAGGAADSSPVTRDSSPPFTAESRVLVGLMSGTSLDGISAAVARITRDPRGTHAAQLLAFRQIPYTVAQRERLARALTGTTPDEYCRLNFDLGHWLADAATAVIADAGVARNDIAAIASHGQTVWHVPGHSTWQFGEAAVIAERTGIDVIADFRVADVAAGGQGAPLVPIADALLFAQAGSWRALQNLGGIGNVTIVPPGGGVNGVRAFDTGPGVVVIDGVTRLLAPGLPYDVDGALARRGRPIESVVQRALEADYFAAPPPKSTGRELFTAAYIERFVADCRAARPDASTHDVVATAVALTAASVADAFGRFVPEPVDELLLSGGGASNPALVDAIAHALAPRLVRRFSDVFFDGEAKEAVAFALLGFLHLTQQPGNVPRVTGGRGPRVLGKWCPALRPAPPR